MLISRRNLLAAGAVLMTVPAIGCSARGADATAPRKAGSESGATRKLVMQVHRNPGCACCDDWADIARNAGYDVSIADDPAIDARKQRLGVPEDLRSCHTAEVGGYVIEGHVPMESLAKLLKSGDREIIGLAVAGMPLGSQGMDAGGTVEAYQVIAFGRSGERRVFADYPAPSGHAA